MPPKNIKLGTGTLYIRDGDDFTPLGSISDELEYAEDAAPTINSLSLAMGEVALTAECAGAAFKTLIDSLLEQLTGIVLNCSNRRVRHLILHGRTWRVRKKNLVRACKIAAKEAKQ